MRELTVRYNGSWWITAFNNPHLYYLQYDLYVLKLICKETWLYMLRSESESLPNRVGLSIMLQVMSYVFASEYFMSRNSEFKFRSTAPNAVWKSRAMALSPSRHLPSLALERRIGTQPRGGTLNMPNFLAPRFSRLYENIEGN